MSSGQPRSGAGRFMITLPIRTSHCVLCSLEGGDGVLYVRYPVIIALTQYVEPGTRGGAVRPRYSARIGWASCHAPGSRRCGGFFSLAVRGGGFSWSKSRYAAQLSMKIET